MANQVGGEHYQGCGIQPIEYIRANDMRFDEGSVVKYITRHGQKKGLEDVVKAIHNCLFVGERCYNIDSNITSTVMKYLKSELKLDK